MNFKKSIAMIVMIAFMTVLGVTAYPLHAQEASPEQAKNAQAQEKPGAVEKTGDNSLPGVKKSGGFPWLLVGLVGVAALAAVLFLVVLKTITYNIVGTWRVTNETLGPFTMVCTGNVNIGTFTTDISYGEAVFHTGHYNVTDKNVYLAFIFGTVTANCTFIDTNTISGTSVWEPNSPYAKTTAWNMVRVSATTTNVQVTQK